MCAIKISRSNIIVFVMNQLLHQLSTDSYKTFLSFASAFPAFNDAFKWTQGLYRLSQTNQWMIELKEMRLFITLRRQPLSAEDMNSLNSCFLNECLKDFSEGLKATWTLYASFVHLIPKKTLADFKANRPVPLPSLFKANRAIVHYKHCTCTVYVHMPYWYCFYNNPTHFKW